MQDVTHSFEEETIEGVACKMTMSHESAFVRSYATKRRRRRTAAAVHIGGVVASPFPRRGKMTMFGQKGRMTREKG